MGGNSWVPQLGWKFWQKNWVPKREAWKVGIIKLQIANGTWIPSNIGVGVGEMKKEDVVFPLAPVYEKAGIDYRQAKALSIHPEGKDGDATPYIQ